MNRKMSRQARIKRAKTKPVNSKPFLVAGIMLVGFVLFLFGLTRFLYSNWDGNTRLSLAIINQDGLNVVILDPASHKLATVLIPGNTVVRAANQMGEWPLSSIPQLAKNEGHTNDFIAQTITKTFYMPIDNWADEYGLRLVDTNIIQRAAAVLTPFESDLTLGDKLKIAWYANSVSNVDRYNINLSDTSYLTPVTLVDGSQGFRVESAMPQSLAVLFADQGVSEEAAQIQLRNNTGRGGISSEMSEIIEVMGGKVFSIESDTAEDFDCVVRGTKPLTISKIASVFNCQVINMETERFDVVIEIGKQFYARY